MCNDTIKCTHDYIKWYTYEPKNLLCILALLTHLYMFLVVTHVRVLDYDSTL